MSTKVFLSLSYVDASFVRDIHTRLPVGLAYFYEQSFHNGELLIDAMERAVRDSAVFVLFASQQAVDSSWVGFEIAQARVANIVQKGHRVLVFPTSSNIGASDLPQWLRSYWVPKAGYSAPDIARYITTLLLEPDTGLSEASIRVVGRGKTLDKLEQIGADFLSRKRENPRVYVLAGVTGIGRRTFANYYAKRALTAAANLPYGPTITLSPQADLADVYRNLRSEIGSISNEAMLENVAAFQQLAQDEQLLEIRRTIAHFSNLGQAVTLVSAGGFSEDKGDAKDWVAPLFNSIDESTVLFVVTNRQLPSDFIEGCNYAVQLRLEELTQKDISALMIFTAKRLGIADFSVPDHIAQAIGGHPTVANAAVRLLAHSGSHTLLKDPSKFYNVQNTILGEAIQDSSLTPIEKRILQILSWVPSLSGSILEETTLYDRQWSEAEFVSGIESLVLSCLIETQGYAYSIASSIRFLFRRYHVSPPELVKAFAAVLEREWKASSQSGAFRSDLFEAFVFMHALEGKTLPRELRGLLSPGTLYDVVRETYARGKDADDTDEMERAIAWGKIADEMSMSEATREEILSTVVRAEIRLGHYKAAEGIIESMSKRGNRSVAFLKGHLRRKQGKYDLAIPFLRDALNEKKYTRSVAHELALSFKKTGNVEGLKKLLEDRSSLINDSAMFADFQIGLDIARGDLTAAEKGIQVLRRLPDDDGKADIREAQVLIRRRKAGDAQKLLTTLLEVAGKSRFRIRSLRLVSALKNADFITAQRDLDYIKSLPGRQMEAARLEVQLLTEKGQTASAQAAIDKLDNWTAEDWLLQSRIWELQADRPETGIAERQELKEKVEQTRQKYRFSDFFDFEE